MESQRIENGGKSNRVVPDIQKGMGTALLAKLFGGSEFKAFEDQMREISKEEDLNERMKVQKAIMKLQENKLKKMELEIKKKYSQSKKKIYGIDNEQEIITQIKRSLKQILKDKQIQKQNYREVVVNGVVRRLRRRRKKTKELDEQTLIALRITANLKELTMKQKIKEMMFDKFKTQLLKKAMFEKMYTHVSKEINNNVLNLRAKKCFLIPFLLKIIGSIIFNVILVASILGNAAVLALDSYPSDMYAPS